MRLRTIAVVQAILIFPALLFMFALVLRGLQPLQYEPAHSAQQLVMWCATRTWTLWVLLLGLPLAVLVSGCVTLRRSAASLVATLRPIRAHWAALFVAAATLAAAAVVAIVVLHMLAN